MLPRCGRAAHICEANSILQSVFPAAIALFETYQFAVWLPLWNKLQIQTRQRGNCCTLAGKSRGGTPFCRTRKTVLPRSNFRTFHVKQRIKIKQSWLQATSHRQLKSFSVQQFFKNAAEVWASSPHLRSKFNFAVCFSCCNCTFWNLPIRSLIAFVKQVANSDKATGQLQHAGRQKQGWNPLLPDGKDRFR